MIVLLKYWVGAIHEAVFANVNANTQAFVIAPTQCFVELLLNSIEI